MGRKSSVDKLPAEVKAHLQRRLRENRLTLDELIADLRRSFPQHAAELPSRSAVHRHSQSVAEIVRHEREMAAAAEALVAELGENFDAKSGALLAQAVTTLASKRAFQALDAQRDGEVMDIADVLDLARAAKTAQEARSLNFKERRAVAEEARRKLLEEQRAKLEALPNKGGVTEQTKTAIREALGIV
ncbi:MAG: hypothetical protein Fur0019_16090 [Tibeticola sp.]